MCIELHVAEKRILTRQSYMKLFNKSSWQTVRLCQDRILKWFTTPTVLSLRLKQDEFEWGRYFPAPPPVSTAVQESQNPSFKVKFTQDTAVQYLHKTTIKLQQNTIDRSPPPLPFSTLNSYTPTFQPTLWCYHLPAEQMVFQDSEASSHLCYYSIHTTAKKYLPFPHLTPPLPCGLLFWLCCVPVLTIKAV